MMVRYCPSCDTEFQPHVVRCSDCGGELEDMWPDLEPPPPDPDLRDDVAPPADYVMVVRDLTSRMAARAGRTLTAANIPFLLGAEGFRFHLSVPDPHRAAAAAILEK